MKYFFDLSTSARWVGHAVGIVRVERELARRARVVDPGIQYCVYDKADNRFHRIKPDVAASILDGDVCIAFDAATPVAAQRGSLRFLAREMLIRMPLIYQPIQRLKGRSFTFAQIAEIRRDEAARRQVETIPPFQTISLAQASDGVLDLDTRTTIISGGLDWEHKDLRAIYDLKQQSGFRYAAIIYDLIPSKFPHFVVPSYVHLLTEYFGELFWVADACMCISESTKNDMLAFCATNGIPAPASAAFPLGGDIPVPTHAPLPPELDGKRYALFVSTIEPRKNHRTVYNAWARCLEQGLVDAETCRLVFVGRIGWATDDFIQEMENNPLTEGAILHFTDVSDAELVSLYRGAEFGLYPSFYEGYGLPLAEMLNHGKACISSRSGSLEEIGGDAVDYVDPLDTLGWAEAIARLFNEPGARENLEARVAETYKRVTWDDAAVLFFDRLKDLH